MIEKRMMNGEVLLGKGIKETTLKKGETKLRRPRAYIMLL